MKCLDCKHVNIIEYGSNGFIGETIVRCKICNEITGEMEDCEDFTTVYKIGGIKMKNLRIELINGIEKYGEDHIDLVMNTENNTVYGGFHSERDSFAVTKDYQLQEAEATKLCSELDIGYFEL